MVSSAGAGVEPREPDDIVITIGAASRVALGSTVRSGATSSPFQTHIVPAATGASGILAALHGLRFWVRNPLERTVHVAVEFSLPQPLAERQWAMAVSSQGGPRFRLDPQAERRVRLAVTPGRQVWPAALSDPTRRDIVVKILADATTAGTLTYRLDPHHVVGSIVDDRASEPHALVV